MKIVDYKLITQATPANLEFTVKSYIDIGWILLGPPFYVASKGDGLCQAMVKYAEDE